MDEFEGEFAKKLQMEELGMAHLLCRQPVKSLEKLPQYGIEVLKMNIWLDM
jgi:hypothetical protein